MLVFFLGCVAVSVRDFLPPDGPYTRVLAKLPRITMQDGAPPGMDCRADLLQSLDLEGGREGGKEGRRAHTTRMTVFGRQTHLGEKSSIPAVHVLDLLRQICSLSCMIYG